MTWLSTYIASRHDYHRPSHHNMLDQWSMIDQWSMTYHRIIIDNEEQFMNKPWSIIN
jgi:hypothetical protein